MASWGNDRSVYALVANFTHRRSYDLARFREFRGILAACSHAVEMPELNLRRRDRTLAATLLTKAPCDYFRGLTYKPATTCQTLLLGPVK